MELLLIWKKKVLVRTTLKEILQVDRKDFQYQHLHSFLPEHKIQIREIAVFCDGLSLRKYLIYFVLNTALLLE